MFTIKFFTFNECMRVVKTDNTSSVIALLSPYRYIGDFMYMSTTTLGEWCTLKIDA